jgi:peptidyl-prolyl cis-trans isomerase A (cyclophilin A)
MTHRIALALLIACTAPVAAQPPTEPAVPSAPAAPAPREDLVKVALDTEAGRIVIALDRGRAPATTANFLQYVESGKYSGESFYRAMPYGDGGFIQGGITSDAAKLAKPVAHEPTNRTGLKHVAGSVSMAHLGPGTAQADFFILTTDIPALDADATGSGFAVFGRVIEGMDLVKKILAGPVSPTRGEGAMKGQMLEPAIRIVKAEKLAEYD